MDDPTTVDTQQLEALERKVAALMGEDQDPSGYGRRDRVAQAVAQARTEVVMGDAVVLVAGRMWGTLAALLAPLFMLCSGHRD